MLEFWTWWHLQYALCCVVCTPAQGEHIHMAYSPTEVNLADAKIALDCAARRMRKQYLLEGENKVLTIHGSAISTPTSHHLEGLVQFAHSHFDRCHKI